MASKMINQTVLVSALPPLPEYTTTLKEPLLPFISDAWLSIILPIVLYWAFSGFFHFLDVYDLFPEHRIHTPEEITKRNRASRWDVVRDTVIQHIMQVFVGVILASLDGGDKTGMEDYDVAVWATRVRLAQRAFPAVLGLLGLNAMAISKNMSASHPLLAGAVAGGYYPFLTTDGTSAPTFAQWEVAVAKALYYLVVPGLQLLAASFILDSWQYFMHRWMHTNKYLYTAFHSRHHRLYVPYAYGALYNHPVESFLLDIVGGGLGSVLAGLTVRQSMLFFSVGSVKTVDDHCGYAFPWDPLQHITGNNAVYHDIHHQTWGIKNNFSQPFFTFWDHTLNTVYRGPKVNSIEERKRREAAAKAGKAS